MEEIYLKTIEDVRDKSLERDRLLKKALETTGISSDYHTASEMMILTELDWLQISERSLESLDQGNLSFIRKT